MSVDGTGSAAARTPPANTRPIRSPRTRLAVFCAGLPATSVNSFSGAAAGVASGIVTCPLDVIKTRLQAQVSFRTADVVRNPPTQSQLYRGLLGTARAIWTEDGVRGMYRGLGPLLLGYLPTWAVYMGVYEKSKNFYYSKMENKWIARVDASITAGACATMATNPIWVVKTRLMAQVSSRAAKQARTPWHYKGTLDAARKMYRAEGVGVFYSGLAPALLGLSHVAIQFPLYEFFKTQFTGLEMGQVSSDAQEGSHFAAILLASFFSKLCATSVTYPHEVLRTRLQTQQRRAWPGAHASVEDAPCRAGGFGAERRAAATTRMGAAAASDGLSNMRARYSGVLESCRTILKEEGWRAFYNGMGTNMVRAVPAAMTTMLTFETLKKVLHTLQREGREALELESRLARNS